MTGREPGEVERASAAIVRQLGADLAAAAGWTSGAGLTGSADEWPDAMTVAGGELVEPDHYAAAVKHAESAATVAAVPRCGEWKPGDSIVSAGVGVTCPGCLAELLADS